MTISSEPTGALVTLETVRRVRQELGCNTILGVSNISFGLPQREIVNSNFFTMAMQSGLTAAIINPNSAAMMRSYYSYRALAALDEHCGDYIEQAARLAIPKAGAGGASGAGAAVNIVSIQSFACSSAETSSAETGITGRILIIINSALHKAIHFFNLIILHIPMLSQHLLLDVTTIYFTLYLKK